MKGGAATADASMKMALTASGDVGPSTRLVQAMSGSPVSPEFLDLAVAQQHRLEEHAVQAPDDRAAVERYAAEVTRLSRTTK